MTDIKGIPYTTAVFDKDGKLQNNPTIPAGITDLLVASHGWNNDAADAEGLYTKLFSNLADVTSADPEIKKRKLAIVGVIWPAKKFDQLTTEIGTSGGKAGGAMSVGGADAAAAKAAMTAAINRAAPLFDDPGDDERLAKLRELADANLENDEDAQKEFMKNLRELVDPDSSAATGGDSEDNAEIFFEGQPAAIFQNTKKAAPASASGQVHPPPAPAGDGGPKDAAGKAAGFLGNIFSGAANAVTNLMNLTSYFEMKKRAGTVGKQGVAPLIDKLADQVERVHLMGHSFGGRVVTAAAANSTTKKLHSMALLQAAFSHNGFSKSANGFFRNVVDNKRVTGPIFVTHTKNDKAVGLAYPAASRLGGSQAEAFGDANDPFGGLGSNGAQRMEPGEVFATTKTLQPVGGEYQWQAGHFHNLDSTKFIIDPKGGDAHGWIFVPEVAWAISRAIIST
jgi:predicted alpha/beta hydrolase family esterase